MGTPFRALLIRTIGHSTRTLEDFLAIIGAQEVSRIVDIRTIPRSRRNPQFNQESFPEKLKESGIDYVHLKQLGGLHHPRPDSPNKGWRNPSFRGFADYMQTAEFAEGIDRLISLSTDRHVAIMCAEALPWRCHRWLISDALTVRKIPVEHIMTIKNRVKHVITKWAHVENGQISYSAQTMPSRLDTSSTREAGHSQ